jgi:hypothetical protein
MSACPIFNVGAPGGQPDSTLINNALNTIGAILNGDVDGANIEDGSVTLPKFGVTLYAKIPLTLFGGAPGFGLGGVESYPPNGISPYLVDLAAHEVLTDSVIRAVAYRRLSYSAMLGGALGAKLFINGLAGDGATGAQAATATLAVPTMSADPQVISGLNIPVNSGSKLSLRVSRIGIGALLAEDLPVECIVYLDVPLS